MPLIFMHNRIYDKILKYKKETIKVSKFTYKNVKDIKELLIVFFL